jgi:hypothetical protein
MLFIGTKGLAMSQSNTKLCQRVGGCGRVGAREEGGGVERWREGGPCVRGAGGKGGGVLYAAAASLQGRRGVAKQRGLGQGWALITSAQRRHIHTLQ